MNDVPDPGPAPLDDDHEDDRHGDDRHGDDRPRDGRQGEGRTGDGGHGDDRQEGAIPSLIGSLFADAFDETTRDSDPDVVPEADFAPLPTGDDGRTPAGSEIDPFQFDSIQAQEAFDAALEAAASGDEEEAVQHYIRASKIAETAREWHLAAVACQRVGDFLVTPAPPYDLERAFRMYRRAVASYEQCGLFAEARELAYRQMCLKLRRSRDLKLSLMHRLELLLQWATAGFGYRPLRVIGTAVAIVLLYAFIYWATQGVMRPGYADRLNFWQTFYFSGVTFATVGYGDFIPKPHTRMIALTEGFVGVFTMGYFVAVLANRLSKA